MNLLYNIKHKGRLIIILMLFVIIEIVRIISQKETVQQLGDSINEIYSDRLIAQNLLFKISNNINEQRLLVLENNNDTIDRLLKRNIVSTIDYLKAYSRTELTNKEDSIFKKLKLEITELNRFFLSRDLLQNNVSKSVYFVHLGSVFGYLNNLSNIQISRGETLNTGANKTISFSNIINELDWVLIIVTALIILSIILVSKSIVSKFPQYEQLN